MTPAEQKLALQITSAWLAALVLRFGVADHSRATIRLAGGAELGEFTVAQALDMADLALADPIRMPTP